MNGSFDDAPDSADEDLDRLLADHRESAASELAPLLAVERQLQEVKRAAKMRRRLRPSLGWLVRRYTHWLAATAAIGALILWWGDATAMLLLAGVAPLWLIYQRMLERSAWARFAKAVGSLQQAEEDRVVREGLKVALELFAAQAAEIVIDQTLAIHRMEAGSTDGTTASPTSLPRPQAVVRLPAGEASGTLSLYLLPGHRLDRRQDLQLAAFADALASALRAAATRRSPAEQRTRDELTGLVNWQEWCRQAGELLRVLSSPQLVAVVLLDIDEFRQVNDVLGRLAGDDVLKVFADRLDHAANVSCVARVGDDEFALLLIGLGDDRALATRTAHDLTTLLAEPVEVVGIGLALEAKAGVAVAASGATDIVELLRRADVALRRAKESGDRVVEYRHRHDTLSVDSLSLGAELRQALTQDQLELFYQPLVDLHTGLPKTVEAQVHWSHPRRGLLGAHHFMAAVESTSLLPPLVRWMIDSALATMSRWDREKASLPVAIAVPSPSLLDVDLPADVATMLRNHNVAAQRLILQITETAMASPSEIADSVLRELSELGVSVSICVGTATSSLTVMAKVPVNELRLDGSVVARLEDSPAAAAIARAVVDIGRTLGLKVAATGVETIAQRTTLAAMGYDAAQGEHIAHAVEAPQLADTINRLRLKASTESTHGRPSKTA
ncbi:MAG TPA: bifunctional diguanylate cyclase/phosphodiesterase [Candidatus Limnocylindrales bacterium]|nr:bifunctional diguanylate cyclase/phosphodiesterase [Candidatus Limnocylindrales bacterium]